MKFVLTGSLGHINQFLIPELIKDQHQVTVITHSEKRVAEIEALGAQALVGNITDVDFLIKAFTGANGVYLMLTGTDFTQDPYQSGADQANIYVSAIKNANVKHIVNLSSIGANLDERIGSLHVYQLIENILSKLPDTSVKFIRPTGMYYNLLANIPTIKKQHVIISNKNAQTKNVWVSPKDIAPIIADALEHPQPGISTQYVASDELTGAQVATILGDAIGMHDLKWVTISDNQLLKNMTANGMPADWAKGMVKMNSDFNNHLLYEDYYNNHPNLGKTKMVDYSIEFRTHYFND